MSPTSLRLGLAALFCMSEAFAATAAPDPDAPLTAADRLQIVATLGQKLRARYVYPERGQAIAAKLQAHAAHGDFDSARTTRAFAEALNRDLIAVGDDRHFGVRFEPGFNPALEDDDHVPDREELEQGRAEAARRAFGIARVQRLPGNIGYLDIRGFLPTEFIGPAYDQALALLGGTDALIIDLRNNGGGVPLSVSSFVSHFFAEGDERHLNDIFDRPSRKTREYWTVPVIGPRYLKPVLVLTSHSTASGAEECAYDLQTQKRAMLVGEITAGAANPGGPVALGHGLVAFVPCGRPINPVTHADWEKVGVRPDIAVAAAEAMKTAYLSLLDRRIAEAKDLRAKDDLQDVRRRAVDGKIELPGYEPRR